MPKSKDSITITTNAIAPRGVKVALKTLVDTFQHRTNQSAHLRALLWSLYNGKPVSLLRVCDLDYNLRYDFCVVLASWGRQAEGAEFFYGTMREAVEAAGQWDWFLEESQKEETLP